MRTIVITPSVELVDEIEKDLYLELCTSTVPFSQKATKLIFDASLEDIVEEFAHSIAGQIKYEYGDKKGVAVYCSLRELTQEFELPINDLLDPIIKEYAVKVSREYDYYGVLSHKLEKLGYTLFVNSTIHAAIVLN